MSNPQIPTNRRLVSFLLVLVGIGVAGLIGMMVWQGLTGSDRRELSQVPTATPQKQAFIAPTATRPRVVPSPTAPPPATSTSEPPTPVVTPSAPVVEAMSIILEPTPTLPPLLPEPTIAPPPTAAATEAVSAGQPRPPAPTKAKPTAKPTPAVPYLPNGVRYGDRKPNLPGRIVRIAAPSIKLDTGVYEVYSPKGRWEVAEYAAGHHYNSVNPGEGGNIVLAGHNNWKGEVFRYLEKLNAGDEITVWTLEGKEYRYQVEVVQKLKEAGSTRAQRLENAKVMNPTPHEQLTLITCWPYTTYTHRLIVIAKPAQ